MADPNPAAGRTVAYLDDKCYGLGFGGHANAPHRLQRDAGVNPTSACYDNHPDELTNHQRDGHSNAHKHTDAGDHDNAHWHTRGHSDAHHHADEDADHDADQDEHAGGLPHANPNQYGCADQPSHLDKPTRVLPDAASDLNPNLHADGDSHPDGIRHPHAHADGDGHPDSNAYTHPNPNGVYDPDGV